MTRPINSSYDTRTSASRQAATELLAEYAVRDVIEYHEVEGLDDLGLREVIYPAVEEVPGIGYRRIK